MSEKEEEEVSRKERARRSDGEIEDEEKFGGKRVAMMTATTATGVEEEEGDEELHLVEDNDNGILREPLLEGREDGNFGEENREGEEEDAGEGFRNGDLEIAVGYACELYEEYLKIQFGLARVASQVDEEGGSGFTTPTPDEGMKMAGFRCTGTVDSALYRSRTGVVFDEGVCLRHSHPDDRTHPERRERILAMTNTLRFSGLLDFMSRIPIRKASEAEVEIVHKKSYLTFLQELRNAEAREKFKQILAFSSVYVNEFSMDAALTSCGGVISLTEAVCDGRVKNGFAIVRPPGHHAECTNAGGFCLIDNVAVAASLALQKPGIAKILIVDWDIHHGNGIQQAFENNPDVLYFSVHRWENGRFYPTGDAGGPKNTGIGQGFGYNINVAWNEPIPYRDCDYLAVWNYVLLPAARLFNPDLIFVSGGFDAGDGDMLGACEVTSVGFAHLLHPLTALANGRIILALEGGYNLRVLAENAITCTSVLLGASPPKFVNPMPPPSRDALKSIRETLMEHCRTPFGGAHDFGWAFQSLSVINFFKDEALNVEAQQALLDEDDYEGESNESDAIAGNGEGGREEDVDDDDEDEESDLDNGNAANFIRTESTVINEDVQKDSDMAIDET